MPRASFGRVLALFGAVVAVALPLVLYIITRPRVSVLFPTPLSPQPPRVSEKFSAQSLLAGYTLTLQDSRLLEYIAATFDLFSPNALANPRHWQKGVTVSQRASVSRAAFFLVGAVSSPIGFAVNPKTGQVWGRGEYDIDGATLVVRIALDLAALSKAGKADVADWDDVFLTAAVRTLYYAKGRVDHDEERRIFSQFKVDTEQYLDGMGVFSRPFRIARHTP